MFLSLCRSCCRGDGPRRAGRQQLLVERRRPGHALQFPRSLPGLRRRSRSGPLHPAAGRNQLRLIHLGDVATRGGYQQHQSLPVLDLVRDLSFPTGLQQQELCQQHGTWSQSGSEPCILLVLDRISVSSTRELACIVHAHAGPHICRYSHMVLCRHE